jgi:hypothetical protein
MINVLICGRSLYMEKGKRRTLLEVLFLLVVPTLPLKVSFHSYFFNSEVRFRLLKLTFLPFFLLTPVLSYKFYVLASALYIFTSPLSNATVNVTVSANGVAISNLFNSTIGSASVVSLPQDSTTTFSATFIPALSPTLFGVQALLITVPANAYGPSLFSC